MTEKSGGAQAPMDPVLLQASSQVNNKSLSVCRYYTFWFIEKALTLFN